MDVSFSAIEPWPHRALADLAKAIKHFFDFEATGAQPGSQAFKLAQRRGHIWCGAMGCLSLVYLGFTAGMQQTGRDVPPALILAFSSLFLAEFALRCWAANSRIDYLRKHWLDLACCVPAVGVLRAVRILVAFKGLGLFGRLTQAVDRAAEAHAGNKQALWYVAMTMLLIWGYAGYAIWGMEHAVNPHIRTLWQGFYWAFITTTTVGYGSVKATTAEGQLLTGLLVLVGIGLTGFASSQLTAWWFHRGVGPDLSTTADKEVESRLERQLEVLTAEIRVLREDLSRAESVRRKRPPRGGSIASPSRGQRRGGNLYSPPEGSAPRPA